MNQDDNSNKALTKIDLAGLKIELANGPGQALQQIKPISKIKTGNEWDYLVLREMFGDGKTQAELRRLGEELFVAAMAVINGIKDAAQNPAKVKLIIVLDTTGSMGSSIQQIRDALKYAIQAATAIMSKPIGQRTEWGFELVVTIIEFADMREVWRNITKQQPLCLDSSGTQYNTIRVHPELAAKEAITHLDQIKVNGGGDSGKEDFVPAAVVAVGLSDQIAPEYFAHGTPVQVDPDDAIVLMFTDEPMNPDDKAVLLPKLKKQMQKLGMAGCKFYIFAEPNDEMNGNSFVEYQTLGTCQNGVFVAPIRHATADYLAELLLGRLNVGQSDTTSPIRVSDNNIGLIGAKIATNLGPLTQNLQLVADTSSQ